MSYYHNQYTIYKQVLKIIANNYVRTLVPFISSFTMIFLKLWRKFNVRFSLADHDFLFPIKTKQIFLITVLEFLVYFNSSVTTVYNDATSDIQCQILWTS